MTTYDLEERSLKFAENIRDFIQTTEKTDANYVYGKQLLRSSSSVGANYIEANDALGKADFLAKTRTSRREAKESRYWLRLLEIQDSKILNDKRKILIDEADQLIRILSAIIKKVEDSPKKG